MKVTHHQILSSGMRMTTGGGGEGRMMELGREIQKIQIPQGTMRRLKDKRLLGRSLKINGKSKNRLVGQQVKGSRSLVRWAGV
jgi:hypothetical protein